MRSVLDEALEAGAAVSGGRVVTYVPALAEVDPGLLGVAVATVDGGHVFEAGDADVPVALMSAAKPFVYALALADRGLGGMREHVDVEPSGGRFDAAGTMPGSGLPYNPMTNMGAIVTTSLVAGDNPDARRERAVDCLGRFAGRPLTPDPEILNSQRRAGDRNRALAYFAASTGAMGADPAEALDRYFAQCAVRAGTRDLAIMAATLAGRGVNPLTGDVVTQPWVARTVLSVMATCGMYDAAGGWMAEVGMAAKSSVSGVILASVPGRLGLAVFSPPIDEHGNSVRGVEICRHLSRRLNLHLFA
ncbi:glutaminase A [Spongiactinospora sp. TRM90649]|uniref:glutaminase A n=1 Tax=Spongiactinospora sp. TRM90649 TaxID=3031114 RepID=UPI0023F9C995|nr:glutaminase A [Spongiactinospora sp. TRM90649]MDF5753683.1 glutaminase A [Spongiactinospora sp. TRM90649]